MIYSYSRGYNTGLFSATVVAMQWLIYSYSSGYNTGMFTATVVAIIGLFTATV